MKKYFDNAREVLKEDIFKVLPGNLAFGLILSIVPLLTLILIIVQSFGVSFDAVVSKFSQIVPYDVVEILKNYVVANGVRLNNIVVMITGFFTASIASSSLILTSNLLYKENMTSFVRRKTKSLMITILIVLAIVVALVFLTFGDYIVALLTNLFNSSKVIVIIFKILKWPIALFLLYMLISMIYILSNNKNLHLSDVKIGSVFASISWCLVTALYKVYIDNFTSYDVLYGSLSTVIILFMWLYILSFILVFGIALNTKVKSK